MTTRSLEGTVMKAQDGQLMVNAERQFQTFVVAKRAVVQRKATLAGRSTTKRIPLTDLAPGEYIRFQLDGNGQVTRALAIALVERAKVRSATGTTITLSDGSTITMGSVPRVVGKPVRAGGTLLLYRNPQSKNVYLIVGK